MLSRADERRLLAAVRAAEQGHRGEIVVHVASRCTGDALAAARSVFARLPSTRHDTAVVLFVAPAQRKVAVWAGAGVSGARAPDFWKGVTDGVAERARAGDLVGGLERALEQLRLVLEAAAPGEDGAGNELPDAVQRS